MRQPNRLGVLAAGALSGRRAHRRVCFRLTRGACALTRRAQLCLEHGISKDGVLEDYSLSQTSLEAVFVRVAGAADAAAAAEAAQHGR